MKKLFALITSLVMMMALFIVPITALADDEQADEGTELVNIDFSDDTVMSDFSTKYGGWKIVDGTLRPETPWANAGLEKPISFEGKRIVLSVDFLIGYTEDENLMPAFTIGIVNDTSLLAGNDARGAVLRVLLSNALLYSYFSGNNGYITETLTEYIKNPPVAHNLEMTFDIDKTLTVKIDGNALPHPNNGSSMSKISLADMYDGFAQDFVGYFAVKATSTDTYIDNIKITTYDTPAPIEEPVEPTPVDPTPVEPTPVEPTPVEPDPSGDEPSLPEPPVEPDPGSGEPGSGEQGGNEPNGNNVEKGGCGSAISGFSIAALVLASGTALAVARRKRNK